MRNSKYDETVVGEYHVIMTVSILESLDSSLHWLKKEIVHRNCF